MAGSLAIENLEASPATFYFGLSGAVTLDGPVGSTLAATPIASANPVAYASVMLGAYDGTTDYAGASGTIVSGLTNTQSVAAVLTPSTVVSDPLAGSDPFVGTGTVALPVSGTSFVDVFGPANMEFQSQASTGATVTLNYNYGTSISGGTAGDVATVAIGPWISFTPFAADELTTPAQTFTVADSTTGWTNSLAAQQFNASLGTLLAVNISLANDVLASVAAANLDPAAGSINTTQTAAVTLELPGDSIRSYAATGYDANLAAYDGSSDFAGPSGTIEQGLTAGPNAGGAYSVGTATDDVDLDAWTGTGTIDLPLMSSSNGTVSGPGNLLAQILAQSGASATISYTYQPAPVFADAGNTVSYDGFALVDPGIELTDAGTSILTGATVTFSSGFLAGDMLLAGAAGLLGSGIAASYNAGTLTLAGTASLADYEQALQSVAFFSTASDPTAGGNDLTRTLSWSVTDNYGASAVPAASTIDVRSSPGPSNANVTITQDGPTTDGYTTISQSQTIADTPGTWTQPLDYNPLRC